MDILNFHYISIWFVCAVEPRDQLHA